MVKNLLAIIGCLFIFQNIAAQETRKPLSADEIKLKEELRADKEFFQVDCRGRRPADEPVEADAKTRLKVFEAFESGNKSSKLKKTCSTIEGDPIYSYLMVEDGKASVVIDTSEDPFGAKRVFSYRCDDLAVGRYFHDEKARKFVFERVETGQLKDWQFILRCSAGEREFVF